MISETAAEPNTTILSEWELMPVKHENRVSSKRSFEEKEPRGARTTIVSYCTLEKISNMRIYRSQSTLFCSRFFSAVDFYKSHNNNSICTETNI